VSGRWLLLYPERGLVLNQSAAEIIGLCDGDRTVRSIVDTVSRRHAVPGAIIACQVEGLLRALGDRGLLGRDGSS
jgi:pyrroloquinoline quinone biosynthesis protein D